MISTNWSGFRDAPPIRPPSAPHEHAHVGAPLDLTSSGGMNPPCGKVCSANTWTRLTARLAFARSWTAAHQSSWLAALMISTNWSGFRDAPPIRPPSAPHEHAHVGAPLDLTSSGGMNPPCGKVCSANTWTRLTARLAFARSWTAAHQSSWLAALMISTNWSGFRDAPPIRPPSTSGWASSSAAFLGFMEPPYWMVTERATRAP